MFVSVGTVPEPTAETSDIVLLAISMFVETPNALSAIPAAPPVVDVFLILVTLLPVSIRLDTLLFTMIPQLAPPA